MAREGVVGRGGPNRPGRRRGLDRTRHRGVDGPAGRLEDGARGRGRVRREDAPQAVRVARVLPRLPARAGRSAAAALDAEPRSARASRLHGLARVLRPRRDLPQRPARLPGARVSAGPWALGRLRPALGSAPVGLADVGARRCRGLPPRVQGRAQPRGASRCHRRRPCGCRRRRPDSRRRGAVREHAPARHARAVRPEGRGGTSTRAHPDERALRGRDRARGHLRPGLLSRLRTGGRRVRLEREVGLLARRAHDLDRVRPARGARAPADRTALRRPPARGPARVRVDRLSVHGLHARCEYE